MSLRIRECRYGPIMYLDNDQFMGGSLETYYESNYHEVEHYKQLLSPGDVVVDVGANIGTIAIPLAQAVGQSGQVYAIEAYSFTSYILGANVVLNNLHNVRVINAVASENASGFFYEKDVDFESVGNFGSLRVSNETTDRLVPAISVDSLCLPKVNFIKIDVEGMEPQVLRGARETIQRHRPYFVVEYLFHHREILEFILSLDNYDCRTAAHPVFNEHNFAGNKENLYGDTKSWDLVCFPVERGISPSPWFTSDHVQEYIYE